MFNPKKRPSRYKNLKGGYSCIAIHFQQGSSLFQSPDNGRIYHKSVLGWVKEINNQQWQDLYRDGTICECGMCISCGVREMTDHMIGKIDEVGYMTDSGLNAILAQLMGREDK